MLSKARTVVSAEIGRGAHPAEQNGDMALGEPLQDRVEPARA